MECSDKDHSQKTNMGVKRQPRTVGQQLGREHERNKSESTSSTKEGTFVDEVDEDMEMANSEDGEGAFKEHGKQANSLVVHGAMALGNAEQRNCFTYTGHAKHVPKFQFNATVLNSVKKGEEGDQYNTLDFTLSGEYDGELDISHIRIANINPKLHVTEKKIAKKRSYAQKRAKKVEKRPCQYNLPVYHWNIQAGARK